VPKKIAKVTMSTTTCPKRTPELKNAKGVNAARYSGLHFIMLVCSFLLLRAQILYAAARVLSLTTHM
jgi:hypothetical protein